MNIRIAGEISESIVDGPGIRYVVFTQGCPHHCVGCHNPETHDFDKGTSIDVDEISSRFAKHPYMSGLTISGGEPFAQKSAILSLIKGFKNIFPKKNILIYTGYTFEQLKAFADPEINEILSLADYLDYGIQHMRLLAQPSPIVHCSSKQVVIVVVICKIKCVMNGNQIIHYRITNHEACSRGAYPMQCIE